MEETDRKVQRLQSELQHKEQQLQQEREMVEKQRKTIKTQSETISKTTTPRSTDQHYSLSSSEPRSGERTAAMYQPPPPFELPGNTSNPAASRLQENDSHMSALSDFGALSLRSPTQDVFQNPNPNPYQSQMSQAQPTPLTLRSLNNQPAHGYHSYQPHYQPAQNHPPNAMADPLPRPDNTSTPSKHVNSAPRTPDPAAMQNGAFAGMGLENPIPSTPQHLGSGSMALVRMEESAPDHGLTRKFDRLFHMAERYSYSHMNFPSAAKDSQLPLTIKDRLMNAATRESAHQLGSTGSTRYFLMTKVILQWMSKHVFKQSLFTGFDLDADRRIAAYKDNIYQDTPPFVKFQLLSEISKEIRQIRENPKFPRFLDTLVKNQGNKLWAIVHPLMHHTTAMDWEDLRTLMYEAYSVAGDAAARPYEWRFDFAQIGSNYNSSMINRDPYIRGHEEELARRALVVRLGFLPAVYLRDNADGVVRAGQVTRHQVLMKGQ